MKTDTPERPQSRASDRGHEARDAAADRPVKDEATASPAHAPPAATRRAAGVKSERDDNGAAAVSGSRAGEREHSRHDDNGHQTR